MTNDLQTSLFDRQPDPCRRKSRGDRESAAAFRSADREAQRERILTMIRERGDTGLTLDEIAERMGVDANRISGRLTELTHAGQIQWNGERRQTRTGCLAKVHVAGSGLH